MAVVVAVVVAMAVVVVREEECRHPSYCLLWGQLGTDVDVAEATRIRAEWLS